MENCVLDLNNEIKIPQSNSLSFIIEKSTHLNYCIKISFNVSKDIDFINLFFILKSYAFSKSFPSYSFASFFLDSSHKIAISQKESITFLKTMDFDFFMQWINDRINNDERYKKAEGFENFYGFVFFYEKRLIYLMSKDNGIDVLKYLKPQYPWSSHWINFFKKNIEEIKILKKENEMLRIMINKLNK